MPSGDSKKFEFRDDGDGPDHDSHRAAIEYDASQQSSDSSSEISYKHMGWKGISEPPEEEYEPEMGLQKREPIPEDDLDMTPICLLYTSPSPRDKRQSRMPSSA